MSVALMTDVWRMDLPTTDKMVLLALADAANDDGVCWIAVKTQRDKLDLLTKCSLSERAVQGALKRLCEAGYLARKDVPGRGVVWTVTPAAGAPRSRCAPAGNDADPRSRCGETVSNHHTPSEAKASSGVVRPKPFDVFWAAYPRREAKGAARKAWDAARKAKKLPPMADLLAALERYRRHKPADIDFCHASTWLNQERWSDEFESASTPIKPTTWAGPPAILAAVIAHHGEGFAASYLATCEWCADPPSITPRTRLGFDRLKREAGETLKSFGVTIAEPQRQAA